MKFFTIKLQPPKLDVSIIIPVKDEVENIVTLASEIDGVMNQLQQSWECIWVDDGSQDGTLIELQKLQTINSEHRFIALNRNYGQSMALAVGITRARGKIFITLDGDGQNNPADIPKMLYLLKNNNLDMVNGIRVKRKDNWIRKISSKIANNFRNWVTKENIRDVGCSLRVFRRECVDGLWVFKGMHRFLPTLIRLNSFHKITEIKVDHRKRNFGKTKYGINNRLWVGLLDTFIVRWLTTRIDYPEIVYEKSYSSPKEIVKCPKFG